MKAPSAPVLNALRDVRRSTVVVSALCDAIILGGPGNRADAMAKLPAALRLLIGRARQALDALEREP